MMGLWLTQKTHRIIIIVVKVTRDSEDVVHGGGRDVSMGSEKWFMRTESDTICHSNRSSWVCCWFEYLSLSAPNCPARSRSWLFCGREEGGEGFMSAVCFWDSLWVVGKECMCVCACVCTNEAERQCKRVNYTQNSSFFSRKKKSCLGGIRTHDTRAV